MNAAIAQHLNILESSIVRVEEWANVLFVVCKKLGARFVSKKIGVKSMTQRELLKKSVSDLIETTIQKCEANRAYYEDIQADRLRRLDAVTEEWLALNADATAKDIFQNCISYKVPEIKAVRVPNPHEGMMLTSTGQWVLAEDWDAIEGGM